MRIPRALSFSSLSMFEKNLDEFYLKYLADNRAPYLPQTQPMSVGSAFDAYAKNYLHGALFGKGADAQFEFDTIFTSQVEEHNRDWAREAGKYVFEAYQASGALADLLTLLGLSVVPPRFEFSVTGEISGVPFTGKPDCRAVFDLGEGPIPFILDWKVKSFCGKHPTSPSKGYALCRDGYQAPKQSKSHNTEHPGYMAYKHFGMTINRGYMEDCNPEYADQCSIYGWLLGETPGDENLVIAIEEIVAKPQGIYRPLLRVANHRARVRRQHQESLVRRITTCWERINSDHLYQEMSFEDSAAYCRNLEEIAAGLCCEPNSEEAIFNEITRPQRFR